MKNRFLTLAVLCTALPVATLPSMAGDAPYWGNGPARNMVSDETGLPDTFDPGKFKPNSEEVDMATVKNIKWVAKVGSQVYGNPTVASGKVFVGTNNETPRDPRLAGDRGIVMCLDEATGKFLWQLAVPKLGTGKVSDWEFLGICSPAQVDGDRVYLVTNRCEVICLDINGMANGNDGPFMDEAKYMAGTGKPPITPGPLDADIIWRFDMRDEVGVFPHNITSSAVLITEDKIFATTSNGQDWSHINIPAPKAPSMIALDKKTGALLGEEAVGIGERLYHANWSSPAYAKVGDREMVVFGAGDGFTYGFDPKPVEGPDGFNVLKEIWRFDCIPPGYKVKDGKPIKYTAPEGPSEVISTPVIYKNRAYVAIGQDPEHGDGVGYMSCIDITKTGDVTQTGKVWGYDGIMRSISTASVYNDLVFMGDYAGNIHCLDADTGKPYWVHNSGSHIWGSTMVADGKLFIGNEDGDFLVMSPTKEKKLLAEISFPGPVYSTPIAANKTLYVATPTHLYAIAKQ